MTETSQGPGWWQASDGKWYAPQVPEAGTGAPPAQSAPMDAKSAKVAAKVAQAQAKALRPWYKKKRFIGLGLIAIIVIIVIAANSGSKSNNTNNSTATTAGGSTATTAAPGTPGLNQVALDGSFAFTVASVSCNQTTLGSAPITTDAPAGSQWCVASMTVKNVKTSAQDFMASNQKATDANGNQLSADDVASIYIPGTDSSLSTVNPGVTIQATVPFRLASGDTIKSLQLHDSAFSGGVTVKVS